MYTAVFGSHDKQYYLPDAASADNVVKPGLHSHSPVKSLASVVKGSQFMHLNDAPDSVKGFV